MDIGDVLDKFVILIKNMIPDMSENQKQTFYDGLKELTELMQPKQIGGKYDDKYWEKKYKNEKRKYLNAKQF